MVNRMCYVEQSHVCTDGVKVEKLQLFFITVIKMNEEEFLIKYEKTIDTVIRQFNHLDMDTIEDLKQELRLYLMNDYRKQMTDDIINTTNHMFIILKRKVIDILRTNKYRKIPSLNAIIDDDDQTELIELLSGNEFEDSKQMNVEQEILNFVKDNFDKKDQKIIQWYYYENLTYVEIGKKLNVSRETVRRKIESIIEKIRKWWQ